ncbi:reticulon family protein [Tieghemostelium lacteum]|uniref:Reticulon-like protein n=1 Tax=Tieghemostelium lacteum TaxID=361077 RepID=A0A151ZB04_TIELA|nr:reticulon family protein [Tieghemostelium lacteum]|eukprot:KYQ91127.1 reticulon family protein [Tieghemostelium lacteum]
MSEEDQQHNSSSSSEDEKIIKQEVEEIKEDEIVSEIKKEVKKDVEQLVDKVSSVSSSSSSPSSTTTTTEGGCPYSLSGNNSMCTHVCKLTSIIKKNPLYEPGMSIVNSFITYSISLIVFIDSHTFFLFFFSDLSILAKQIVLWEDLIQTGLLFIIINTVFFITCCLKYSLVSLVGYVGFVVTAATLMFKAVSIVLVKYAQGITLDNQITDQLKTLSFHVHEAVIEKQATNIAEFINQLLAIAKDVFSVRSIYLSAQYLVAFYLTGVLGKCISLNTIAYVSFLVLFIAPRVYLEKKDVIDPQIEKAKVCGKDLLTKLHSFIPISHSSSAKKNN